VRAWDWQGLKRSTTAASTSCGPKNGLLSLLYRLRTQTCLALMRVRLRAPFPQAHEHAQARTLSLSLLRIDTLSIARSLFCSIGICSCTYVCFKFALDNKCTLPFCLCLSHTPSRSGPFFPSHTQVPAARLLGARVRQNRSPRFSMFRYRIVRVFKNRSVHNFILLYCYREL